MGNRKIDFQTKEKMLYHIANDESLRKVARKCGVAPNTVRNYRDNNCTSIAHIKKTLADKCDQRADEISDSITPEDIKKASLLQKGTFTGIMIYKARLLREESTANIQTNDKKIVIIQKGTCKNTIEDVLRERQKAT